MGNNTETHRASNTITIDIPPIQEHSRAGFDDQHFETDEQEKNCIQEIIDLREKEETLQKLINRVVPFLATDAGPSHGITADEYDIGDQVELIIYKIIIKEMSGRFENC